MMLSHLARRPLEGGQVRCERFGVDVDVERCLSCPAFEAVKRERGAVFVCCRPVSVFEERGPLAESVVAIQSLLRG